MEAINNFLLLLDSYLGSAAYFPYILLGVGIFFTLYLGFPQIRFFGHAWKVVTGKFDKKGAKGDTSHFQALSTALSGTVGTGNIGGVALAIFLGGPAALFWMWITAFLGMTTKFVEVTLSHKYRVQTEDGTMAGGPMYYMDRRLNMKWLAVIFAVATIISSFGTGNMPQINNIAQSMEMSFGVEPMLTGGILAILLAMVIIGGIKRIAAVTSRIVPIMGLLYIIGAFSVILYNLDQIGPSFAAIFTDAFTGSAATGGFLGATFAYAFNRGVNRGLFSNEAGQGSAPIAHASARADEPVSEGLVSILEPFIDTIVVCTLTGLVILSSGVWSEKHENNFSRTDLEIVAGNYNDEIEEDRTALYHYLNSTDQNTIVKYTGTIEVRNGEPVSNGYTMLHARSVAENVRFIVAGEDPYTGMLRIDNGRLLKQDITIVGESLVHSAALTSIAFSNGFLGDYGEYIVPISLLMFAFSTAIAWSYYGDRAVVYLFGQKGVMPYRIIYVAGFFIASFADTTLVWTLSYVAIVLMTLPNLLGIVLLRREMKDTVKAYWQDFDAEQSKKKEEQ
ncbi:alanine/glycine:cation symporter family protein [Pseudidiomarina terrestris]|uniref:AGCS family amino acid carrier protein n=1 Tax=Pseudidiomarina terrestris TaxID=2820060 RepID=A0AAW7QXY7_9GAMM|nr:MULTISPECIES: AGCS family amino acid carrier protein [unclassified Pseudidiomarina]MDN7123708.1 AGCS family amino acid carrier protein [Pseudidiomarina sp. 1APP75-32.1]MDN7126502.1 AGCS family amino acid carrier protein [Pseudidiomarina sp. 1APR75-33.1]MDN7128568.1 AGCS family amino acid carrier protein [Pseudidiomarina sp. 1APR75-15]MDN7135174.1 AGCS family amino acid carrier protein [Pseudidiomarina sp. 1ASP75-5]MDN7137843.1 AGCS family amino acid carrier protein [Pseudidiomarina sp. 1ASP